LDFKGGLWPWTKGLIPILDEAENLLNGLVQEEYVNLLKKEFHFFLEKIFLKRDKLWKAFISFFKKVNIPLLKANRRVNTPIECRFPAPSV
jgi:hypothetical protein